ncbi:MAG TPA: hypothetical protein VG276_04910 [Actinomycetes bacterium]|jgi:hypothetical protein|nr:hypothetical protein [Actinomycetes bacterium]
MANTNNDRRPTTLQQSSERWLEWLGQELAYRGSTPRSRLLVLWDVLEEWFATDEFHVSAVTAATAGPRRDPGDPVIAAHRQAMRQLLEDLANAAGVRDPAGLAVQLQVLVEGTIVGALVDREPRLARHARELTEIALDDGPG